MNKQLAIVAMGMLLLVQSTLAADASASAAEPASATAPPAAAVTPGVIASAGEVRVTLEQIQKPMIEAYGLNILLNVTRLELVKNAAAKAGVKVTPQDIDAERDQMVTRMFKDANEKLTDKLEAARTKGQNEEANKIADQIKKDNTSAFDQYLQNQHITRPEFGLVMETNTYLRKLAEPMLIGKISDDNLQQAFKALYGETVKCRHIECANLSEIQEVKRRLAAGQPFQKVAQELSRNASTGPVGGDLPPFSLQTQGLPQQFKDSAFALKEGQISDIVQTGDSYHLILLEKRIAPKAVKFDDVKDSLKADLQERAVQATIKGIRQQLDDQAVAALVINEPTLKAQWAARIAKRDTAIKEQEQVKKQMELERKSAATQPAPDLSPNLAPNLAPAK